MKNLRDVETRVIIGYSGILTGGKGGNWHGYQKREGEIYLVILSDTALIPGLHKNLFSVVRALQTGIQVTPKVKGIILKKQLTKIRFPRKWKTPEAKALY